MPLVNHLSTRSRANRFANILFSFVRSFTRRVPSRVVMNYESMRRSFFFFLINLHFVTTNKKDKREKGIIKHEIQQRSEQVDKTRFFCDFSSNFCVFIMNCVDFHHSKTEKRENRRRSGEKKANKTNLTHARAHNSNNILAWKRSE